MLPSKKDAWMTDQPQKVDLLTPDIAATNREMLEALLPGVIADGVLDATRLGELLDLPVTAPTDGRERFGLMWAGKHEAIRSLLTPSRGTLIPDLDRSIDFDNAQNVFIEGDNLEVLKLLQKAYNDQVKLIYIDPPYNTGNDFVYRDDFSDGLRGYLEYTGQLDEEGNRTTASADTLGRRHSGWLSMMYPRLVLARNLLTQDGAIFVSIDDNEVQNLRLLMDEVFGPENFLGCVTVVSNLKGRSDDKFFATAHNYLLGYKRNNFVPRGVPLPEDYLDDYPEVDADGNRYRLQGLRKRGSNAKRSDRPSMYYPFYVSEATGSVTLMPDSEHTTEVLPRLSDGSDGRWRWGSSTAAARLDELKGRPVGKERRWDVFQVDSLERDGEQRRATPKTVWDGSEFANEAGGLEVKKLLGGRVFDNPKPVALLKQILEYSVGRDDLVLDFFAGSGTTAHAALALNRADGGRRRCISVNLPEPTPIDSDARRAGYATVSEITYARLRAAMDENNDDQGLRVFTLGSSCFEAAISTEAESLLSLSESTLVDPDVRIDAVASEVLVKEGIRLDAPWQCAEAAAAPTVEADGVVIVLARNLENDTVDIALSGRPRVLVFLEDAFAGKDAVKVNAFTQARELGITMKTV